MRFSFRSFDRAGAALSPAALGAILLLLAGAIGCDGEALSSSHPDGGTTGEVGVASLQGIFKAFCAAARICCAGYSEADLDDCEEKAPRLAPLTPLVEKGQASVNPAVAAACEAAYAQVGATCDARPMLAACRGLFVGLQGENQPCDRGEACAEPSSGEPTVCLGVGKPPQRSCHTLERGQAGDICDCTCPLDENCSLSLVWDVDPGHEPSITCCFQADGLYCSQVLGKPHTCAPLAAVGESCTTDPDACGWTYAYCDPTDICQPNATFGQPCGEKILCDWELECGPEGTCTAPRPTPFADYLTCTGQPPNL